MTYNQTIKFLVATQDPKYSHIWAKMEKKILWGLKLVREMSKNLRYERIVVEIIFIYSEYAYDAKTTLKTIKDESVKLLLNSNFKLLKFMLWGCTVNVSSQILIVTTQIVNRYMCSKVRSPHADYHCLRSHGKLKIWVSFFTLVKRKLVAIFLFSPYRKA